jgi:hypothetical protein
VNHQNYLKPTKHHFLNVLRLRALDNMRLQSSSLKLILSGLLFYLPTADVFAQVRTTPVSSELVTPVSQPELQGRKIRSIDIVLLDVFDGDNLGSAYEIINKAKINTRKEVIARELRFKVGALYDEFTVRESARQLRTLRFFQNPMIRGFPVGEHEVDIVVTVKDTWTLIPQASLSRTSGKNGQSFGMAESNLLGYGKRVEVLKRDEDNRSSLETIWDDPRFLGTYNRFLAGYFDRSDGERTIILLNRPFLSFLDEYSWTLSSDYSNGIGRLFEDGDEDYIFRRRSLDLTSRYIVARGNPAQKRTRYSIGFQIFDDEFIQASDHDYELTDLDPKTVDNNPDRLAKDRRFIGPEFGFETIQPDFITMNYIDRFDRYEDYNLGYERSVTFLLAPKSLGSSTDALILNGNNSKGIRFSNKSFLRAELGFGTRIQSEDIQNTLVRGELKYFNVLGSTYLEKLFLGRHTLATQGFIDYGYDIDPDRQFLLGGDDGVRGYKARAFSGNKRFSINLEDRIHIADDVGRLVSFGLAAFIDAGGATNQSLGNLLTNRVYTDAGVGLRLGFPRSSGGGVIRLDLAVPLRNARDGSDQFAPRITIGAGQIFGSRLRSENLGTDRTNIEVGLDRR